MLNTKNRSTASEIMDDLELEGEELKKALKEIATVNKWLGGNKVTVTGVENLLQQIKKTKTIRIIDVGCGNGDMCRALAMWGRKENRKLSVIGIDANAYTLKCAQELSYNFPEVSYREMDIFSEEFDHLSFDIAVSTLTMHHFDTETLQKLLGKMDENASIGIVINDLHRSAVAYRLYQLICSIFRTTKMFREDGLVSILRGFKKKELVQLSETLNFKKYTIRWKWAFRYQWIISKI